MLLFTERVSRHALQNSLPTAETTSSSLGNSLTLCEGLIFGSFAPTRPDDRFFPKGGFECTFLFRAKSDAEGAFTLSRSDTVFDCSGGVSSTLSSEMSLSESELPTVSVVLGKDDVQPLLPYFAGCLTVLSTFESRIDQ